MSEPQSNETASQDQEGFRTLFGTAGKSAIWAVDLANFSGGMEILRRNLYVILGSAGAFFLKAESDSSRTIEIESSVSTFVVASPSKLEAVNGNTDCLLFGFDRAALSKSMANLRGELDSEIAALLNATYAAKTVIRRRGLPCETTERLINEFREAHAKPGSELWFESRVREVMALAFFDCESDLAGNVDSDVFERVKAILEESYQEPLDLDKIASDVGLSPSHLSRRFSAHENMTIKGFLRSVRLKNAAILLSAGDLNISEVASQVGYRSLSHFSKAFVEEMGCLPSQYKE